MGRRPVRAPALLITVLLALSPAAPADCDDLAPARALPATPADQWSLATFNLWRLRDTEKDARLDQPLSESVYQARLDALAAYITDTLNAPVLLAVQEVEHERVLKALQERIRDHGGPAYRHVLIEGHDPSGMDVALLYRPPARVGASRTLFHDDTYRNQPLYSRPPLVVALTEPVDATLVVAHLRSANDLGKKAWVAEKRRRQAERLTRWLRRQDGPVALVGDLNSAPDAGLFSEPWERLSEAGYHDSWQGLKESERYSYRYRCRPQAIDHILLSPALAEQLDGVAVTRGNAGRYDTLYGSDGAEVVSDHDVLVTFFD